MFETHRNLLETFRLLGRIHASWADGTFPWRSRHLDPQWNALADTPMQHFWIYPFYGLNQKNKICMFQWLLYDLFYPVIYPWYTTWYTRFKSMRTREKSDVKPRAFAAAPNVSPWECEAASPCRISTGKRSMCYIYASSIFVHTILLHVYTHVQKHKPLCHYYI